MSRAVAVRRSGFVLPAAIIALVLLSTLLVGALFVATEELRAGRSDLADERALTAAEHAVEQTIATWPASRNTALAIGETIRVERGATVDGDAVEVTLTRTQLRAVWVVARASAADGRPIPARRAVSASLRLSGPTFPLRAALAAAGAVTVQGGMVDGRNEAPGGARAEWCTTESPASVAGVIAPDSTRVCGAECTGGVPSGVTGVPPLAVVAVATSDSAFNTFGDESRSSLAARATVVLERGSFTPRPVVSAETCDVRAPLNWGDPDATTPCRDHYPIVWIRGDAMLAAGAAGQGILLVDGDLTLAPGARFVGVVVASDDLIVQGPGATIAGVAFAADADGADGTRVLDGGAIRFDSCAARVAVLAAARPGRTPERWWAELR